MKLKVIITLIVCAISLGMIFQYLRSQSGKESKIVQNQAGESTVITPQTSELPNAAPSPVQAVEPAIANDTVEVRGTIVEHETYVEKRVAELQDLAMDEDPKSLQIILSELTNRDPEIRQAAVDAAVQFGSRDAIPRLTDAASQTEDAGERAAILEAAEYLKLPSYRETAGDQPVPKPAAAKARNLKVAPASTIQH